VRFIRLTLTAEPQLDRCPIVLPSPHHRPQPLPGRPIPADVTDPGELDAVDVANYNAFIGEPLNARRAAVGLPAVDDVRAHIKELFGRVAAVVHHGRAGITTTAARAGAPQVVVPQVADQPYWAGRVAALGVGVAHDGPIPTCDPWLPRSAGLWHRRRGRGPRRWPDRSARTGRR
jgi:hypothetical protein